MCNPVITNTIFGIPVDSFKRAATPAEVAGLFCALTDDQMAEFFVAVKKIEATWEKSPWSFPGAQWWFTGGHLAECPGVQETETIEIMHEIVRGYDARQRRLERAGNGFDGLPSESLAVGGEQSRMPMQDPLCEISKSPGRGFDSLPVQ